MRATYGSLVREAWTQLRAANHAVHAQAFEDRVAADAALRSYFRLLESVRSQTWALIVPSRLAGLASSGNPASAEAAAVALLDVLPPTPRDAYPRSGPVSDTRGWPRAAACLNAAADLISTHVTPTGGALTPDAERTWDTTSRAHALAGVGDFTLAALTAQDTLALRCGQAGIPWAQLRRCLPGLEAARRAAWNLSRAVGQSGEINGLGALAPSTRQVRVGQPVEELGDRISRLRRMAWALRETSDFSVGTLEAINRVGFATAVHTATFHGIDLSSTPSTDPTSRHVGAWLRVLADMRDYRSAGATSKHAADDSRAIRRLLEDLAPYGDHSVDRGASADIGERHLGATLHAACAAMMQAADWGATTFSRLARSGHVYVHAADLTGDELTDEPELAAAHLQTPLTLVRAPGPRIQQTLDRYREVTTCRPPWAPSDEPLARSVAASGTDGAAMALERSGRP